MVETLKLNNDSPKKEPVQGDKEQSKSLFQQTSLDVWQLYKQSLRAIEVSYL